MVNISAERVSQNQMALYPKWKSVANRNSTLRLESLAGHLEVGVYVKIINKQNDFELYHSGRYLQEDVMERIRNFMFAVLELALSCPVVVTRLLQYDMVQVVVLFFFLCCVLLWDWC